MKTESRIRRELTRLRELNDIPTISSESRLALRKEIQTLEWALKDEPLTYEDGRDDSQRDTLEFLTEYKLGYSNNSTGRVALDLATKRLRHHYATATKDPE